VNRERERERAGLDCCRILCWNLEYELSCFVVLKCCRLGDEIGSD